MRRVVIVGFDGLDPNLIWTWKNRLHNFNRLLNEGATGKLRSTIHPLTPQAWTSLICGTNCAKHGIYDFGKHKKNSYQIELVNSTHRRTWAIWELASFAGVRVGIFGVPLSWPVDRVNGFLISGMHSPELDSSTYPKELAFALKKNFPNYRIDAMVHWYSDENEFLNDSFDMLDVHFKVADWLWQTFEPELFFATFVSADRIMHALWRTLPENIADTPDSNPIFLVHKKLDEILGWAFELVRDDDLLIVCSDHGFGPLKKDVYLNRFLADAGYLRFDPKKVKNFKRAIEPRALSDPCHSWHLKRYANPSELPADDELIIKGKIDPYYLDFETIDWENTLAYSAGMMGNIFINTEGLRPQGIVRWGKEYEELVSRLMKELRCLCDPDDKKPLVSAIYRREQLYWGPYIWDAPDILVVLRDYEYVTRGATEFWGKDLVSTPVVNHSGNHRLDGFFAAWGSQISKRTMHIEITDIAPILLVHLGIPLPKYLDGKLPISMYNNFSELNIRWEERDMKRPERNGYSPNEEEVIRRRLKGLGYFG